MATNSAPLRLKYSSSPGPVTVTRWPAGPSTGTSATPSGVVSSLWKTM